MTDWGKAVAEYGPLVWRTAYRLLSNEADAADCFQRTFLSAVELNTKEPIRNWAGVLRRLATARALEQLRTRYREKGRHEAFPDIPIDLTLPDPLEVAAGGELAAALRVALADIDPVQAEVFCLVCLEGFTYPDAANGLGITANHLGVLLNRARAALRDRLRAFDPSRAPGGSS